MENENNENQDSLTLDEEITLEETTEEVDVEKLKETNKKLFERAKNAEAKLKQVKPHINRKEEQSSTDNFATKEEIWAVADYIREGYDRNDVNFILKNGGREALNDSNSYVSVALKAKSEQRRAEQEAAKTTNGGGMSEIERKYTPDQLANMTSAELEKILPRA